MADASQQKNKKPAPRFATLPVNTPTAKCSPCPRTANMPEAQQHQNRRIYRTAGKTRYCVCDECGETWKMVGDQANDWADYLKELAASLEKSETTVLEGDPEPVIIVPKSAVNEIVERLRAITTGS